MTAETSTRPGSGLRRAVKLDPQDSMIHELLYVHGSGSRATRCEAYRDLEEVPLARLDHEGRRQDRDDQKDLDAQSDLEGRAAVGN